MLFFFVIEKKKIRMKNAKGNWSGVYFELIFFEFCFVAEATICLMEFELVDSK